MPCSPPTRYCASPSPTARGCGRRTRCGWAVTTTWTVPSGPRIGSNLRFYRWRKMREVHFEPTFHKHVGQLCAGLMIHAEGGFYDHAAFRPWRLQALAFKAIRRLYPDYPLWRDFAYEYEHDRLAIDLINGSPLLREWVDDPATLILI